MGIPSKKLEKLAHIALMLDLKSKEIDAQAKQAKQALIKQLIAEGMFDPSTQGVGDARLAITPNRYFDIETAKSLVTEEDIKESTVEVVDPALLKQHMTKIQLEKAMKSYDVPYKVGLKVNEFDTE